MAEEAKQESPAVTNDPKLEPKVTAKDEFQCPCGNPDCVNNGGTPKDEPGFFTVAIRTVAYDLGRRLVRWAVPGSVVIDTRPLLRSAALRSAAERAGGGTSGPKNGTYL